MNQVKNMFRERNKRGGKVNLYYSSTVMDHSVTQVISHTAASK